MWIEFTRTTETGRPAVTKLKAPGLDDPVEFTDNGKANVPKDDAEYLIDLYDDIQASESDDDAEEPTTEETEDTE